jgi:hypothetical protein
MLLSYLGIYITEFKHPGHLSGVNHSESGAKCTLEQRFAASGKALSTNYKLFLYVLYWVRGIWVRVTQSPRGTSRARAVPEEKASRYGAQRGMPGAAWQSGTVAHQHRPDE